MNKLEFDWRPLALVPALALLAFPLIGSGSTWLTLTVAGLAMGMIIFIIASGLTLVFGLMDVLNFGHGVFIALGAYVATSVLATVIGHQLEKGWVMLDAGWMAMSRDQGTGKQKHDYGYGQVCAADGTPLPGYVLSGANQEHGIISRRDGAADPGVVERFPIGTKLRLLPNHACATAAQFAGYHALQPDGTLADWPRWNHW